MCAHKPSLSLFSSVLLLSSALTEPAFAGYWWYQIDNDTPTVKADGTSPGLGLAMAKQSYYDFFSDPPTPECSLLYNYTGGLASAVCKGKSSSPVCAKSTPGLWSCSHAAYLTCNSDEVRTALGCVKLTGDEIAPEPSMCNGSGGSPSVGNPIAVLNGTKIEHAVDYQSAGPLPLTFERFYRSGLAITASTAASSTATEAARSMFGRGWRSNLDTAITFTSLASFSSPSNTARVNLVTPEGEETAFIYSSSKAKWLNAYYDDTTGSWKSGRTNLDYTLTVINSGGVQEAQVLFPDDRTFVYDFNGRLKQIRTRGGFTLTPAFNASSRPTSLTDSFARTLTFTYSANGLLDTMTTPEGKVYRYAYLDRLQTLDWMGSHAATEGEAVLQSLTSPDGTSVTYAYENTDYPYALTGITDGRGVRYATFAYDSSGRAIETTHAGGDGDTKLAYSSSQNTVTNPLIGQTVYTYATTLGNRRVSKVDGLATTHCAASNTSYAYDSNGFVNKKTDAEGNITTLTSDTRGLPLTTTEGSGSTSTRTKTITWDGTWHIPTRIVETGRTSDFTYDSAGRLVARSETDTTSAGSGAVRTFTYTYSNEGLPLSFDGPLSGSSDTTTYTYDASGYLSSITDAAGHVTRITAKNGSGYPLTVVDANGIATAFTYDAVNRLTAVTLDKGGSSEATMSITYDAAGDVTRIVRADGSYLAYTWNDARRLTLIADATGDQASYTYDAKGNVTGVTYSDGNGTTLTRTLTSTYDELGRLLSTVGAEGQTTSFAYDRNDEHTGTTDPRSNTTSYSYDALNRLIATTDPEGGKTMVSRDANDAVTTHTDAKSVATTFTRNGWGEALGEQSADIGTFTFTRDSRGLISETKDARGLVTDYAYDSLGRMTAKRYPSSPSEAITFTYDAASSSNFGVGRLTGFSDASGSTAFAYTRRGELSSVTSTIAGKSYALSTTYDAAGRVAGLTYPSGREVLFLRNSAGSVEEVRTRASSGDPWSVVLSNADFLPFGPFHQASLGNGLTLTHDYTKDYRISAITLKKDATTLLGRTYTFGDQVNITKIEDSTGRDSETFSYTPDNRLQSASGPWGDETFTYDANGNRTGLVSGSSQSIYALEPLSNRMTGVSGSGLARSFSYDAAGNLISDARGSDAYAYTYDAEGELASVTKNGVATATYLSNALGELASRTLTEASGSAGTTHYIYDSEGHLIAEADGATGKTTREYLWLGDLPIALVDQVSTSPTLYWIATDHLYRPIELRDSSGAAVWSATFDPYGDLVSQTGSLSIDSRFPGQWYQPESGLFNNWHRHYDPTLGRYTTPDPIGLDGGPNRFTYVDGNPTNWSDPKGYSLEPTTSSLRPSSMPESTCLENAVSPTPPTNLIQFAGTPIVGPPNGEMWLPGPTLRVFDQNGNASYDIDFGHDHGAGQPHAHNWDGTQRGPGYSISILPRG